MALQVFDIVGEAAHELCSFVKADEKELIFWIGGFKELEGRFLRFAKFIGHAATEIEDDADRDRNVFGGEIRYLLLDIVFENAEVIRLQAGDNPVVGIGHSDVHEREIYIDMDRVIRADGLARRVMFHVVRDVGLGGGRSLQLEHGSTKEQEKDEVNEENTSRGCAIFHDASYFLFRGDLPEASNRRQARASTQVCFDPW